MTFPRSLTYPLSRRDHVIDVYHGVAVADPYRWLEDPDSADTIAWTEAQNALTRHLLGGPLRDRLRAELTRAYDYERISAPEPRGSRYFYTRNAGLQNQPILHVQDGLAGERRVLIDPNALSADGTVALTFWQSSDEGRFLAYALSSGGSDWQTVHVRDVEDGADLPDELQWAKFVTIAWDGASRGFFYTRFPENGSYHPSVWWHTRGDPQSGDVLVHGPATDPEIVFDVALSSDGRFLVITSAKGASDKSSITVIDLAHVAHPREAAGASPAFVIAGFDNAWSFIDGSRDELFFRTTHEAPRGRIVAMRADGSVREVVAESADSLIDGLLVGGRLAALYLRNASSRIQIFTLDGGHEGDVALPALGSVSEISGEAEGNELFARFASFTHPPTVLRYSISQRTVERVLAELPTSNPQLPKRSPSSLEVGNWELGVDASFVTRQVWYPSRDGTRVSMFLVHASDAVFAGTTPVWLTGYGGFNVNILPEFDPAHLVWLARGGLLAVPNLRGGGEYGDAWHEAGMLDRKQTVFDDFIAAGEWLIAEGVTRARRLVLEGGSNGGLLVAAVMAQRPDLPGAVICRVPVADMLRYHLFTVGRFWIPEYGSSDSAGQFTFLHRYSPLHAVRDDIVYPPVLITTAETDDRVDPGMARKLAARLQAAAEAAGGGGPVLIRIERRAGHGAGKPVAKLIDEDADIYTLALRALGVE